MKFKKIVALAVLLVFVFTFTAVLSGCSEDKAPAKEEVTTEETEAKTESETQTEAPPEEPFDPMAKYDPPIVINVVEETPSNRVYLPGESYDNNIWTRAYEEELGITFNYLWVADSAQYKEKLNIAIVSDDMPDVLEAEYGTFYQLAKADRLEDITDVYDKYASDLMKDYASRGDSFGLRNCTLDGKQFGVASTPNVLPADLLFIRDDWMSALNLEDPKTMDDVIAIARAFTTQDPDGNGEDDTFGIGIDKEICSNGMDLKPFFNGYNAYPQQWVEVDGKLEWGSIQPETKEVLEILQSMFAEGMLNSEFPLLDTWEKSPDDIRSGKVGMLYGANWIPYWTPLIDLIADNTEATWSHYQIPSADGQPGMANADASINYAVCVIAGYEHPEALIKMLNMIVEKRFDPEKEDPDFSVKDDIETHFGAKYHRCAPGPSYASHKVAVEVSAAFEKRDPSGLSEGDKGTYDQMVAWVDDKDPAGWGSYSIFGPGGTMLLQKELVEKKYYLVNAYTGPKTDTMIDKAEAIRQKEVEIFTQIIMGASIDTFDEYVSYFYAQGGDIMTEEVNEWYALQNK